MAESRLGRSPRPEALLDAPPFRALLRLALPTTAVMTIAALSNILHTYFVSELGGEAIAAVSLVFPVSLILTTMIGGGIGSGVSSAVARALGADDAPAAAAVAQHAFSLTLGLGATFSVLLVAGAPQVFGAMGGKAAVLHSAVVFARVLYAGLLITFFVATCDSILRGAGNVRIPAIASTVSLVLQITLTPLLMFTAGLGIAGAALAAIVGQTLGGLLRLRYVFGRRAAVPARLMPRRFRSAPLLEILRVGVPASLGTLVVYVGLIVLTTVFARLGTEHLAAFGLGSRFDFLIMTMCYGTGIAVLTLIGFASGAGRSDLVFGYAARALALMAGGMVVPALALWLEPRLWLGLFTDDAAILEVGRLYFRTIGPTYPFIATARILSFSFQGLGRALNPLAVAATRVLLVTTGAVVLTASLGYGEGAVFSLMATANCLSALALSTLFIRVVGFPRAAQSG